MPIDDGYRTQGSPVKFVAGIALLAISFIVAVTIVFGSWYTINQTERGVLLRNGARIETVQPGLHFKYPWIESVYKIDMQTHTKVFGIDPKTGKSAMEAYSADQQPAHLRVSVTMRVAPDKVGEMYDRFAGDYEAAVTKLVQPRVYERTKVVFGRYTAASAITARGQLNAEVSKSLSDAIAYDPIFILESVQIEDISYSGDYIKSVEQRMQAEVEVQKMRQTLEREKVQAAIAVTQAQGRADAVIAEAKAAADATVLKGEAEAKAIQARGDALNKNPTLVALVQAERWDGKLPTTMVPGGSIPMLNLRQ